MLLSDRDLLAEIEAGSLALDPFDASLVQPSSIDVRLDRFFRVFNNEIPGDPLADLQRWL